jgi:parvulin-like peptidyl-prolyl isomerase
MTFRTRTAPRPTRRRTRRSDTRRAVYITLTFSLAIVAALSLMGGVFVASYYQDHGAAIASVNAEGISKDQLNDRIALDSSRFKRQLADYQTMRNQGKITSDEYTNMESAITTSQGTVSTDALTELVNETELRQYASKNGISVTDQQVDAQIKTDGTIPEMRHVKIISVPVMATAPATSPTQADSDAALAQAQAYLKEIQGGKAWDDVFAEADAQGNSSNTSGGDKGLVTKDNLTVDPDLADAIFNLSKTGDITDILKGSDGAYRFATITNIVASWTDNDWQSVVTSTANGDAFRFQARNEAIKKAVQTSIEAKYVTGSTQQSYVNEIAVSAGLGQAGDGDEVKIKIMVFAPAHSTSNASNVPATDPAWTDALNRANAAVATLRTDPSKFATMAADTTVNDDSQSASAAGDIPWIPGDWFNAQSESGGTGLNMLSVAKAVFTTDPAPGSILDPIQEAASGYVVVLFQGRRPAPDQRIANALFTINSGTSFTDEAKAISESSDAITGGDLGWVSPYMLTSDQQAAIDQTPVGGVSNIVESSNFFLYQVVKRETRVADPDQQAKLQKVVFGSWLSELQANSLVWKDAATVAALASATAAQ